MPFLADTWHLPAQEPENENLRIVRQIRDLLADGEHWCQGSFVDDGRYCLIGAAGKIIASNPYEDHEEFLRHPVVTAMANEAVTAAGAAACEIEGDSPEVHVIDFNDNPDREFDEITTFLDRVEARFKG